MTGVSFLIDTDWVIDHLNSLSPATQRLRELEPQGIAISIITVAELWEGVIFSRDRLRSETMLREFVKNVRVIAIDEETCQRFGQIRGTLRKQGKLIGDLGMGTEHYVPRELKGIEYRGNCGGNWNGDGDIGVCPHPRHRFPLDFMFRLSAEETENLRSQFATSSGGHGGRRYRPYAFTEHGAVMLASVLNSKIAVAASVQVVRAFVRLRQILAAHKDLAAKLAELETRIETHDENITALFEAIRQLMEAPARPRKPIGFAAQTKA